MPNLDLAVDVTESFAQTILASHRFIDTGVTVNPQLYLGGTLVNDKFMTATGRCELQLNGRGTAAFTLTNPTRDYRPTPGETILLKNNGVVLFAGVLNRFREHYLRSAAGDIRRFECEGIDYAGALDRRFITAHLKNPTLSLQTIITNLLFSNQIKPGPGSNATDITECIFVPGVTPVVPGEPRHTLEAANQVMQRYSDSSGYSYFVDENRRQIWRDHAAAPDPAPWNITDDQAGRRSYQGLEVDRDLSQYANRVWVRTSLSIAPTYTDTFTGDGSTKIFKLRSWPSLILSITVDGVEQSFGTLEDKLGLDDDCIGTLPQTFKQWYYFPITSRCDLGFGSPLVEQHDSEDAVAMGLDIVITYKGPVSNFAFAEDTAEQATRAAEEGGTGIYEAVFDEKNVASEELAQTLADALLAKHKVIPLKVNIKTQKHGLRPGQTITIDDPKSELDGDFLIQRVSIGFQASVRLDYSVECVSTSLPIPRPEQFLEKLVAMARLGSDPLTTATAGDDESGGAGAVEFATFNFAGMSDSPQTPITGDDQTHRWAIRPGVGSYYEPLDAIAFVTDEPMTDDIEVDVRYIDPLGVDQGSIFATPPLAIAASATSGETTEFSPLGLILSHGGYLVADVDQIDADATKLSLKIRLRLH